MYNAKSISLAMHAQTLKERNVSFFAALARTFVGRVAEEPRERKPKSKAKSKKKTTKMKR